MNGNSNISQRGNVMALDQALEDILKRMITTISDGTTKTCITGMFSKTVRAQKARVF